MKLFPTEGGLVTLWAARSLSAILGAASIPAIFGMGWLVFRSASWSGSNDGSFAPMAYIWLKKPTTR